MSPEEKKQKIIGLRQQGLKLIEIGKILGVSNQYVSKVLKDNDIKMNYIDRRQAEFSKVPPSEFARQWRRLIDRDATSNEIDEIYESIELPVRATAGSAGYDFFSPLYICLKPGETIHFPTGIRCKMPMSWCLLLMPKSGLGTQYQLGLNDTVGLIDADYYFAKNTGHIMVALTNRSNKKCTVEAGKAVIQGVFLQYGLTIGDYTEADRTGGFGSTGK